MMRAALLAFIVASGAAMAGDPWDGHALSDDEAARRGRAALPFTPDQILALGRIFEETRAAASDAPGARPEGRQQRVRIEPGGMQATLEVVLAHGYTTAVSILDMTGEPWPIEEVLVDARFLPRGMTDDTRAASHILYLSPAERHLHGNAIVKLADLAEPLAMALTTGTGTVDFHVDLRVAGKGPNADPSHLVQPRTFHAGDEVLLDLLAGVTPHGAARLSIAGASASDRAWSAGDDILLLSRALVLTPGPWAAERSADGRWAWRLPATPFALVSRDGREARLGFRRQEIIE